MRAYLIIIFQVRQQYVTEVPLSEHNNVVKAFPSDRTDQPFGTSILPRGAWRRWSVANAHRSKSSDEDNAIGPIAVADQIVGSPFPAESFRNLICNPFCDRRTQSWFPAAHGDGQNAACRRAAFAWTSITGRSCHIAPALARPAEM